MKKLRGTIMALLAIIMVVSGVMVVKKQLSLKKEAEQYQAIQKAMTETVAETESVVDETPEETLADETVPETVYEPSAELTTLMETYPDCIGYISIEGTKVSYPIMQNADNEYYLHRDMAGKKAVGGCIYMDSNHDIREKGLHVIYGHHMRNGSMFRDVARFTDASYMAEHQSVVIQTDEKELKLKPVYCYAGKADGSYRDRLENHGQVIDFIKSHTGLDIDADDLYVLVTCSYGSQDERTYLYCVPEE